MSAAWPSAGVSTTTGRAGRGAHADQHVRVDRALADVRVPVARRAELVAGVVEVHEVDPAGDRLDPVDHVDQLLARRRSAWQVSRQKPTSNSPTASQRRASASNRRAIAWSPPAVFSISTGTGKPPSSAWRARNLRQFVDAVGGVVLRGDVPAVHHQPDAPRPRPRPSACWVTSLRDGMRIRLFGRGEVDHVGRVHDDRRAAPRAAPRPAGAPGASSSPAGRPGTSARSRRRARPPRRPGRPRARGHR